MKRRRVTVSPSKAPGIWRSAVYFDFGLFTRGGHGGANNIDRRGRARPQLALWRAAVPDGPRARLPGGPRRLGIALGVRLRARAR